MSDIAITVENLSKRYRIGLREELPDTFAGTIAAWLKAPLTSFRQLRKLSHFSDNGHNSGDVIWAVNDVSFEVKRGEVMGIIGRNGAGKTTLLKIVSRITMPTAGRVILNGRVSSLLEVGTGFHPELTGRENVYLNGAVLGMSKTEIDRKFDEIVAFAEVEKFIDTPVKRYSSGMYVRLAFAVAAHLEPEILLVDEVLAVGDIAFQKKCLGKMETVTQEGRTVLFVSHNVAAISRLCDRTVWLDQGELKFLGVTEESVRGYLGGLAMTVESDVDLRTHPNRDPGRAPLLKRVRFLDSLDTPKTLFRSGEMIKFVLDFDPIVPLDYPQFGIGVNDSMGTRLFSLLTYSLDASLPPLRTPCRVICQIDELPLAPGRYSLSLSVGTFRDPLMDNLENAVFFDVEAGDFFGSGKTQPARLGGVLVRSRWTVAAG
jgi:lipopolysaccharide transport system ATP-binding protein